MATSIADLFVNVSADVSGAVTGLTSLTTELDATTSNLLTAAPAMLALAAAATEIDSALISAVTSAADFESNLIAIQNNTTMTNDDFNVMHDAVLALAVDAPVSFDKLSEGFMHVSNFGFSAADATVVLEAAMRSAVSTGGDTAATAQVLAAVLHEFGLGASDASATMDQLHIAAAEGNMTLEQFSNSFGQVAAWAAAVGVPLDEAAAAMSAMTRHGFESAEAAVQVKDQIEHIIKPSEAAKKAMVELSNAAGEDVVQAFSSTFLHAHGLTGVMDLVTNAMDRAGLTADQQTAMWLRLVPNIRGGAASFVLAGRGADDFRSILSDMNNSLGATDTSFARTQNTANFQWGVLTNQIRELGITFGTILLPPVERVIETLSGLVKRFQEASPELQRMFTYATIGAAAFIGFVLPLALIGVVIGPLIGSFIALGGLLLGMVPVFAAIAVGAGLLWLAWQDDIGGIQELTQAAFAELPALLNGAQVAFGALRDVLSTITVDNINALATSVGGSLSEGFSKFGSQISPLLPIFSGIGNFLVGLSNLIAAFDQLKSRGAGGATSVDDLTDPLQQFFDFVTSHADEITSVQAMLGPIGPLFAAIRDNGEGIAAIFNSIADSLNAFAKAVKEMPDLPPWMQTMLNKGLLGGTAQLGFQAGTEAGKANAPGVAASWNPAGPLAPLIQIGSLVISNEAERQAFLDEMATMIAAAAGRVLPAPATNDNPRLAVGTP